MIQPLTVMVEPADALVAQAAVLRACVRRPDVAQMAAAVLDHVPMLGPIELGHDAPTGAASLLQQGPICRIDERSGQMQDDMDGEQDGQGAACRRLNGGVQSRYENDKAECGEKGEHEPAG